MSLFLVDSSIWIALQRGGPEYLAALVAKRYEADQLATCAPVALEVLVGPPDGRTYDEGWSSVWEPLRWLPLGDAAARRALLVQRELAHTTAGGHRRSALDYLIAACAEEAGRDVVLWHWDSDLTVICEHTGQPHESEHERARQHGVPDEPAHEP